jgi:CheY-like chemotaxis protein
MIVEDDPVAAADLALLLPEAIDLVTAADSLDALDLLVENPVPDAIILDLNLPPRLATDPDEEGLALLARIRGELALDTPVIVLSRNPAERFAGPCRRLGIRAYLQKPCRVSELLSHLLAATGS